VVVGVVSVVVGVVVVVVVGVVVVVEVVGVVEVDVLVDELVVDELVVVVVAFFEQSVSARLPTVADPSLRFPLRAPLTFDGSWAVIARSLADALSAAVQSPASTAELTSSSAALSELACCGSRSPAPVDPHPASAKASIEAVTARIEGRMKRI